MYYVCTYLHSSYLVSVNRHLEKCIQSYGITILDFFLIIKMFLDSVYNINYLKESLVCRFLFTNFQKS